MQPKNPQTSISTGRIKEVINHGAGVNEGRVVNNEVKNIITNDDVKQMYINASVDKSKLAQLLYLQAKNAKGTFIYDYYFDYKLDNIDYQNIAKIMNICNGRFVNLFDKNTIEGKKLIQSVALLEKNIRKNSDVDVYLNFGENELSVIFDSLIKRSDSDIDFLNYYKLNTWDVGNALSDRGKTSEETLQVIKQLTEYLDTQSLSQTITVSRGELYNGCLNNIKLEGSSLTLAQQLQNLAISGSESERKAFVEKNLIGRRVRSEEAHV